VVRSHLFFYLVEAMSDYSFTKTALEYIREYKWYVFPTCWPTKEGGCGCGAHTGETSKAGKQPLIKGGHNSATIDTDEIARWGRRWPVANIAVSLNKSGIVALDADNPEAIQEIESSNLPKTAVVQTGRGRHYYFSRPDGLPDTRIIHHGTSGQIDILSSGGLMLPPSTHYSQATYKWIISPEELVDGIPVLPPSWVGTVLDSQTKKIVGDIILPDGALSAVLDLVPPVKLPPAALLWWNHEDWVRTSEGKPDRSNTIAKLSVALARNGIREVRALAEILFGWDVRAASTVGSKYADRSPDQRDRQYMKLAQEAIIRTENARIAMAEVYPVVIAHEGGEDDPDRITKDVRHRDEYISFHPNAISVDGVIYDYKDGLFTAVSDYEISKDIQGIIGNKATARGVQNTIALLKGWLSKPSDIFMKSGGVTLVFTNGTFDFDAMEFRSHRVTDYARFSTGYAFDEDATAPTWEKFLLERFSPEVASFLQEFAGLCLTRDMRHETGVFLYSPPGAGKSTFIYGLQIMLGSNLWASVSQREIATKFGLPIIEGKTLLLATEQPSAFFKDTSTFNSIISGDPITIEKKYKEPYTIYPATKVIWAMNEPLRVSNMEDGIFRRIASISMTPIPSLQMDHRIREKLDNERAGILNWAIAGALRLFSSGEKLRNRLPEEIKKTNDAWQSEMDIAKQFVQECCEYGDTPAHRTWPRHLYARYSQWCKENGYNAKSEVMASREWQRLGVGATIRTGRKLYTGLRLLNLDAIESIDGE